MTAADIVKPLGPDSMEVLNSECFCISLDTAALRDALESEIGQPGLFQLIQQRCPYLFAARPVFLSHAHMTRMAQVIQAIESVVALPAYRDEVLATAPAIAHHDPGGAKGVFFGYDFHVTEGGFGLIEINTNAGGAMLNAVLARAQRACCPAIDALLPPSVTAGEFEDNIVSMFRREWALCRHDRPLRSIAIVDEKPEEQYLYPEFLLFQRLFQRHGLQAVIAGPAEFSLRGALLWHGDLAIDLVYNRLTDFSLAEPASATLREAYFLNAMVLTPHPQAHALYADKRNLAVLSDATRLQALGVPQATQDILLAGVPHTEIVQAQHAERLWRERRRLFFKPFAGFGGRAAYRGDKLTQRVWQEILAGGYVAQALVAPGARVISNQEPVQVLKFDLRDYAYDGRVQWVAARLYQGQTTNFRTPGGGFAPVYEGPAEGHAGWPSKACTPAPHESRPDRSPAGAGPCPDVQRRTGTLMKPTRQLHDLGQSLWLDNITRTLLDDGTLARYIAEDSITGLTSNPSIFDAAIGGGAYDPAIHATTLAGLAGEALFTELALEDLRRAADLFRPVFDATDQTDGWVSMEISPLLAADTAGSIAAARQIHDQAQRANLFVKIPGTPQGVAAIEQAIFLGIPINVTLLFSCAHYLAAAEAYLRGIERRLAAGLDLRVGSVASLFISRWDVGGNPQLPVELQHKLGIAVARQTYRSYRELLASTRWQTLAAAGAKPQRLLWASTGTKDPAAPDTLYVTALAAPDTIDTIPEKTLHAFANHGRLQGVMPADGGDAEAVLSQIHRAGVDIEALAEKLQQDGAQSFVKSWQQLLQRIADKSRAPEPART